MTKLTKDQIRSAYRIYQVAREDARGVRYPQAQIGKNNQRIETGTIKFVHPTDHYGFIVADRDAQDIWCAPNTLPSSGFAKGDRVSFRRRPSDHKPGTYVAFTVFPADADC
jgi:cold shock CspA family protein